ncbi:MAG: TonB-dependent receptor [Bacteroidetes bacterium]|nr:TonB-dependent receptor [Bacteroidota bacterium]
MRKLCCAMLLVFCTLTTMRAQSLKLTGSVTDSKDNSPLIGATIAIAPLSDTTNVSGVLADEEGEFEIEDLSAGDYRVKVSYIGYTGLTTTVHLDTADKDMGILKLHPESEVLKVVTVTAEAIHVQQKADTTEYNAASFKTNPDANAEDLVNKMPGITSTNGTVTAHGEKVQKVLVDGKEFFGDDATTALKNLPAEVIDKVQVYDRLSDQSAFTGFDDGNSQKTINVTTKKGRNNGVFGKLYAGYGYLTESRYSAGGNVNWFNGDRRLSLIGMSNNINQQNFSSQDLLGVSGTGGGRGGRGGGGNSGASNNFLVGNQGGISTTHALGFNYSDVWGKKKKVKVTGSYFFNYTDNTTLTSLDRNYFGSNSAYRENDSSGSVNQNHRINLRIEYAIDSFNSLIFTPKFSYQQNTQDYLVFGQSYSPGHSNQNDTTQNKTATNQYGYNAGYTISGDILYQHKFPKKFRTFSIDMGTSISTKSGNGTQLSNNLYYSTDTSTNNLDSSLIRIDQRSSTYSNSYSFNANVSYTEPVGKTGMIQLNYTPSYTINKSDKEIDSFRISDNSYQLNTSLSSKYKSNYMTQKAGINYRFKNQMINASVGISGQYALLTGDNVFPTSYPTLREFYSPLPNAMLNVKFKNTSSLRIQYRTSTSPPSISQLQSVIDNSNPLLLSTGNPFLKQSYNNSLIVRYGFAKGPKGQSLFVFGNISNTINTVVNSTTIAGSDDVKVITPNKDSVQLKRGQQITFPVNRNGYWNANAFFTYGVAITPMKCNFNLNGGINYSHTPGLINDSLNFSSTYSPTFGATLSSNISEKIDFTIGYSGSYNFVQNTRQTNSNNNYYSHSATAKFNWLFYKGFVFNTSLQNLVYIGHTPGYNQDIPLWNASLGYKFLKDQSLEVKAGVNDILNMNSGVTTTYSQTYSETDRTQVLKRYMLVTVTWTMRYFKKGAQMPTDPMAEPDPNRPRGGRGGGGQRQQGGE